MRVSRHYGSKGALFALLACLAVSPLVFAETDQAADRFDRVFDRSGDSGKLVARFLRMSLVTKADDKSGDCAILTSPDGKTMLIDAGAPECYEQVERCLDAMGVTKLDAILASHPHIDHIGGLARILERYPVPTLYSSEVVYPTGAYRNLMATIERKGIEIVYLEEGSTFSFGALVSAEVFNPEPDIEYYEGYPANSTQFVNDKSLVVRFAYGGSSMLFMGDVYTSREIDLVEMFGERLKSDLIKAGHHGSDTSSSKTFIRTVSPKIAAMMHDNLASLGVYKNYRKAGAAVYATCLDGCIKVSVDEAGGWSTLTQFDRQGDFLQ